MTDEISMQKKRSLNEGIDVTVETNGHIDKQSMDTVEHSLEYDHLYDIEERKNATQLNLNKNRTPVAIKWSKLTYSVQIPDPNAGKKCCGPKMEKIILNNVSGSAKPGQLVAIMGPSGSGKTTLLNILSGRCVKTKGAKLMGYISVNNINKSELGSKRFSQISAYVQQDDILFNMQTVKETLFNAARLRLPKEMSLKEKENRVDNIIQELGLKKAANTRVGDAKNRGISGGERKRTNIAVEMIQDPSVLFLDEPTSGLDSFQALNVMETLKILCMSGVTVIVSVHQPRSSIYKLFDQLILLAEGRVAYSGEAGETVVSYFSKLGLHAPSYFNPGDYFLDIISEDNRSITQESKSKKRVEFILTSFDQHELKRQESEINFGGDVSSLMGAGMAHDGVTSSICEQFMILATRNSRQIIRDKFTLGMRVFMSMFFALFLSALWGGMGKTDEADIQNRNGILFFIAINQSFGGMISTLQVFIVEKTIVMRERQAHCYYLWIYYFTKLTTQLPVDVIVPCIFASIVYWIVGLNPDPIAFLIFLLLTVLISLSAVGLGFAVGSCAPNIDAGNAMAPLLMVLTILFGGFYINADSMPEWIGWLENLSTIRWCFEAYCINEFKTLDAVFCSEDGERCTTSEQVLEQLSFDKYGVWIPVIVLTALFAGFHVIAFTCLKFNHTKYIEAEEPSRSYYNYDAKQNIDEFDVFDENGNGATNNGNNYREANVELNVGGKNKKKANSKTPLLK
mmetsp:Transcript_19821/g.17547  ORF Transcript_19821/g.17547 Transcript_19821/m.17547 type:complete len:739 (+) Transcript_19821:88-2304(+)